MFKFILFRPNKSWIVENAIHICREKFNFSFPDQNKDFYVDNPQPCRMRSKPKTEEDTQIKVGRVEGEILDDSLWLSFVYSNLGKFIDPVRTSKPWRSRNRIRFNLMTTNEQDMFIYKCRICYCTVTKKSSPLGCSRRMDLRCYWTLLSPSCYMFGVYLYLLTNALSGFFSYRVSFYSMQMDSLFKVIID